jgi:hypothetical protein
MLAGIPLLGHSIEFWFTQLTGALAFSRAKLQQGL